MKIEYNGEMVEAYDLVISRKIAEQIIKGERTLVTYWASLYYQNKFIDNEQEEINQKEMENKNKVNTEAKASDTFSTTQLFEEINNEQNVNNKNYNDAYNNWSRCVILAPKNADYRINLGNVCNELGKYDEAVSLYKNALNINSKSVNVWFNID